MSKKLVANTENFLWSNFKMYLLTYQTCLLDLICPIKDPNATKPIDRYEDLLNFVDTHIGLASYVTGQAAQFSKTPYITVNIATIPTDHCGATAVIGFDVVYATDTPPASDDQTQYIGSSSESVAAFRADIAAALDQLFYYAYGDKDNNTDTDDDPNYFYTQSFYDELKDKKIANPTNPDDVRKWQYNIVGETDDNSTISEVSQLKREDRSTQLNVFHLVYKVDVNGLYNDEFDLNC